MNSEPRRCLRHAKNRKRVHSVELDPDDEYDWNIEDLTREEAVAKLLQLRDRKDKSEFSTLLGLAVYSDLITREDYELVAGVKKSTKK